MLAFTKSAPEIDAIAPPHLVDAFRTKLWNLVYRLQLSYADDIGVWFSGLNACNFRRILLLLLFAEFLGAYGLAKLCCNLVKASIYKAFHVSRGLKKC